MNDLDAVPDQEPGVIEVFTSAAVSALQELTQFEAIVVEVPGLDVLEKQELVAATIRLIRKPPGTMTLLLTEESASKLAASYLPRGTALSADMINDVAGEFANVIAGQAKTILKGTPYHFALSVPTVTRVQLLSQLPDILEQSRMGSVTFDAAGLILFVQLPQ